MNNSIWGSAAWITSDLPDEAPLFRCEFETPEKSGGKIRICGLGFFELYLNGRRVSEDSFVPVWSSYSSLKGRQMNYPINDEMKSRAYYLEYDITALLRPGKNIFGIRLGNGWYAQRGCCREGDFTYGIPKLCFTANITPPFGEPFQVNSGNQMKWHPSEIKKTNIYLGETHDYRDYIKGFSEIDFNDEAWRFVTAAEAPSEIYDKQSCPADKIIREITPTLLRGENDLRLYDCGENISGHVVLKLHGNKGKTVTIRHSEELSEDGTGLDFRSAGGDKQIQQDTYICGDTEHIVFPRFTWHGFRYFEITGEAEVLRAEVMHTDVGVTSSFECSNETLNWLYEAYIRSQLTNIHCCVPSDCPHRERLGYTGDGQITTEAALLTLDIRGVYDKWMRDIADGQDPVSGHVQHTAPFYGGGGGPGGWGSAIYRIPMAVYRHSGDKAILEEYYENMRLWLDYMENRCENGLVIREEEGGWCLGDWCTPEAPKIPEPFVNTYYYIKGLDDVALAAEITGHSEDAGELRKRARSKRSALCAAYLDNETGSFCGGVNGADAFALDIETGNPRTEQALIQKYKNAEVLDTGIFGTDLVIDQLFRLGECDLACRLLTASFNQMKNKGATTLWEYWCGKGSHNHPMFGGVARTLFTHILGIKRIESAPFYEVQKDAPLPGGITWARGHITLSNGERIAVKRGEYRSGC